MDDLIKLLTVLHRNGHDRIVTAEVERLSTAELRDALKVAVRLLADVKAAT
jgi:hypothetical protein